MKIINKHFNQFNRSLVLLKNESDLDKIRFYINEIMIYMEDNHLHDKHYLDKSHIFYKAEKDQSLLKNHDIEILFSFLTMIYRIDFVDANSDGYIIYYKNGMIIHILEQIVCLLKEFI